MKSIIRLLTACVLGSPLFANAQPFFTYPVTANFRGYYTGATTTTNGVDRTPSPSYRITTTDLIKFLCQEKGLTYVAGSKLTAEYQPGNSFL
jgi:hypothetical protein